MLPNNFDAEWYTEKHADVRLSGLSASEHYLQIGQFLGRECSQSRSTKSCVNIEEGRVGGASTILLSILAYGTTQNAERLLKDLPAWIRQIRTPNTRYEIVVRVNNPNLDPTPLIELTSQDLFTEIAEFATFRVAAECCNLGFGRGHNKTFEESASDYFVILNDDLGFANFNWLPPIVSRFENSTDLGLVGDKNNPRSITRSFANGTFLGPDEFPPLVYAEASVLIARSVAFSQVGGFDTSFRWAMFEDSDLSFRVSQNGWRVSHAEIPHQHVRSESVNSIPSATKMSILENNRALFFARWGKSLQLNKLGSNHVVEIVSEGIGDVLIALLCLRTHLEHRTPAVRKRFSVRTNHREIARLCLQEEVEVIGVGIDSTDDFDVFYREAASVTSTRRLNYALPFNLVSLVCSALGLDSPSAPDLHKACQAMAQAFVAQGPDNLPESSYCVLHFEHARACDGRFMEVSLEERITSEAARRHANCVLVGLRPVSAARLPSNVIDLRGKLSFRELLAVVARAAYFVGIDSSPFHIAQIAGVPSVVFFGSVNPLSRVLDTRLVWPLVAELDCIGCYHDLIDCGMPFCMRRDNLCTSSITDAQIVACLNEQQQRRPADYDRFQRLLGISQTRLLSRFIHHPAPPAHFINPKLPNEKVSNFIYQQLGAFKQLFT